MQIRAATPADAAEIADLHNALLTTTTIEWTDVPHSAESRLRWMAAHDVVLVAEVAGRVVGVAAYGPFRDIEKWPGYRFTVELSIHVREDQWGAGVGRRLVQALVEDARTAGKHVMIAAVDGENAASIAFHERLGFVEVAQLHQVGAKFGRWLDLVLLQLALDDRSTPPA